MTWKTTVILRDSFVCLGRLLSSKGTLLYDLKTTVNLRDSLVLLGILLST